MSQENVEIVRAAYDAWNAGDTDAVRDFHHPNVIARYGAAWPEPGPFVGREEVMRQWERNREAWDSDTFESISIAEAGDRVIARLIWRGVGRGPEAHLEFTAVYTVREGKVLCQESFWDHAEALVAVGLLE